MALELGEETVRSHLKKAQGKLGAQPAPKPWPSHQAAADPMSARI